MLLEKIEVLIHLLDKLTDCIARGEEKKRALLQQQLPGLLEMVFPAIVESYSRQELEAVREDRDYWVQQLERIALSMQGNDSFAFADVLRCETKENLVLFKEMIGKAGLTL